MTYSIIGSGNVGTAIARLFARSGIAAGIANTRGPATLAALTAELGDKITALPLQTALKADVLILAVPFRAHQSVADIRTDWAGKIIVDAMNAFGLTQEELRGLPSSEVVESAFPGAKLVKTLNQLSAKVLAKDPAENGGRRVMFVSSDDEASGASIAKLVEELGFAAIKLGKLNEGGSLLETSGPLILQNLIKQR